MKNSEVLELLELKKFKLAIAESLTGGLLCSELALVLIINGAIGYYAINMGFNLGRTHSISKLPNSCFVDSKNMKSFDVLRMMRGAQAYVLSNSTLGWWAAFLSMPQQVFAPPHWFAYFDHPKIRIDEWTWN